VEKRSWWKVAGPLLGNGLLGLVLSLVFMGMLAPILQHPAGIVVTQLLVAVIFYGILYGIAHREGRKEFNKVKYKHIDQDMWWGAKCSLLLTGLMYLPFLALVFCKFVLHNNIGITIYKFCNPHLFAISSWLVPSAQIDELSIGVLLALGILPLTIPLVTGVAYMLGYKRISVLEKVIYISKKK